jgi:hypothetical protein
MPHHIDPSFRFILDNAPDDLQPAPEPKRPGIVSRIFKRGSGGAAGHSEAEENARGLEAHYRRFPELRPGQPDQSEAQQSDERIDPQPG